MTTEANPNVPPSRGEPSLPAGIALVRPRRKHDRTKYPWKRERLRRKVIQFTLMSSAAVLFLFGALYLLLSRQPPSAAGSSREPVASRTPAPA
jgi:hypothetical protein